MDQQEAGRLLPSHPPTVHPAGQPWCSPKRPASWEKFWTSSHTLTLGMGPAPPRHSLGGEGLDSVSWLSLNLGQIPPASQMISLKL